MEKKKPGPVPEYGDTMRHVGLRLPLPLIDKALQLGKGAFSKGVRLALEQADDTKAK